MALFVAEVLVVVMAAAEYSLDRARAQRHPAIADLAMVMMQICSDEKLHSLTGAKSFYRPASSTLRVQ